ncbi:MAG: hypothetical protein ACOC21_01230 [Halanaerobiales bacterium]
MRCWKERISRVYDGKEKNGQLICNQCGNIIGQLRENNRGEYYKMDREKFTYSGQKIK